MSSKGNGSCKTVTTRSNKNIVERKELSPTSEAPSEGLVVYDNCNTLIEVTVKTKGRKRTSTMVSNNPTSHKGVEEKRKPGNSSESHSSWGRVLREQTLQHIVARTPVTRPTKNRSDAKDTKKQSLNNQRNNPKHLDEIPIKQSVSQKKLEEQTKSTPRTSNPSTTSLPSSAKSVLVIDRSIQCSGIFDSIDRYGAFNPVRTLGFLMKELEDSIKDDQGSKILTHMEQVLLKLSADSGKSFTMDTGAAELRSKLEATTIQLEDTTKEMNAMCEALREERDCLKRQVMNQNTLLNEAREMHLNAETIIKTLKKELEEAKKIAQSREKTITELREGIKNEEFSQQVIANLRTSCAEQSELARQRHLKVQLLTIEKDKLSALSSHKDSLLAELRNSIKELQSQIADQLSNLITYAQKESINDQISLVHGGHASSSPTSSSSQESNMPTSWHDVSDVSLSTVGHEPPKNMDHRRFIRKPEKIIAASESHIGNMEQKRTKTNKDHPAKDSTNLEFVSLPYGESSHTLLPSYKDYGSYKGKEDSTLAHRRSENWRSLKNLSSPPEKLSETKSRAEEMPKTQKSLEPQRKQTLGKKSSLTDDCNQLNLGNNLAGSSMPEVFNNIFHDIRMQSRMLVKLPSPPRNFPHPDWSDSTLSSISTASELNVIPTNDT
ncbi:uncharacterized protein LOC143209611 isoform X1 [Lasioglossum baleicum]|uniref:uncharacterized protein LOC143209611 isoform X1 n=1 Tax=Lasioglossum baleicum TaxID=434251 RepID=UPI003FCC7BB1